MTRRSLRPHLNQIRSWVRQGRTDAWIAHQLEVTVQQIQAFKREQELEPDGDDGAAAEVDLRAEDDEAIAAELEAEAQRKAEEEAKAAEEAARKAEEEAARKAAEEAAAGEGEDGATDEDAPKPAARRRTRRPRRRKAGTPLEGTFDHGEEGYGLWLDPAVQDDPVYAEHWAGHRPIEVVIEEDQIVIRRAGGGEDDEA
jgi:septal ring factor EnvC (AmiA/AmiB activator)